MAVWRDRMKDSANPVGQPISPRESSLYRRSRSCRVLRPWFLPEDRVPTPEIYVAFRTCITADGQFTSNLRILLNISPYVKRSALAALKIGADLKEKNIIEDLKRVASLSRLGFDEKNLSILIEKARSMLGYIEQLNELDTEGIEPTSHAVQIEARLREDSVESFEEHDKIIEIAPEKSGHFVQVPKVIDAE